MKQGSWQGIDEMNIAEFALGLLATRPPGGQSTVEFEDTLFDKSIGKRITRKVVIATPEIYGLPTQFDQDVMMAAKQLTWLKNRFANEHVEFSRYELCKLLKISTGGREYKRLVKSLDRWGATYIKYNNSFRVGDKWTSDGFTLLQGNTVSGGRDAAPEDVQTFSWATKVQKSIQSGHIKEFDFDFYQSLKLGSSKRLYRLLDKRFWQRPTYECQDLADFCVNKLGMSRHYPKNQYRRKLLPAIEELQSKKFLAEQKECDLFKHVRKNIFAAKFRRAKKPRTAKARTVSAENKLLEALKSRGINNARSIVASEPAEKVERAILNYDDRNRNGENKKPGWLRNACRAEVEFGFRDGYRTPEQEKEARAAVARKREKSRQASEERHLMEDAREQENKVRIATFLQALPSDKARQEFEMRAAKENTIAGDYYFQHQPHGGSEFERFRDIVLLAAIDKVESAARKSRAPALQTERG